MVDIYELEVLAIAGADVTLRVRCSKGTYIRTLCADVGEALGVGGHLRSLQRTRVGPLAVEQALTLEEIGARVVAGRLAEDLLTLDDALATVPAIVVDERTAERVRHGAAIQAGTSRWATAQHGTPTAVRVKNAAGQLLAVGKIAAGPVGNDAVPGVAIEKVLVDVKAVSR